MTLFPDENGGEARPNDLDKQHAAVSCGIRLILFTLAILVLGLALWRLRNIVLLCFGALIGALILRSLSAPLSQRFRISEAVSLSLTILVIVIFSAGFFWFFGNQTATEFAEFQRLIPTSFERLSTTINGNTAGRAVLDLLKRSAADTKTLTSMGTLAGGVVEGVTGVMLVGFLSIYFAFSPEVYASGFMRLVPKRHRLRVREALLGAMGDLKKWLVAQLYAMVIIGVLVGLSCALLKIPLALLLGVIAGFLEFIPAVGPVAFTIPAVLVALTQGPATVLKVLIVYFGVQQLESYVITPLLQQRAVKVPPAVTLLAIVVGGLLLGPMGVIFGLPMTVALISLGKRLLEDPANSDVTAEIKSLKQF